MDNPGKQGSSMQGNFPANWLRCLLK